MTNRIVNFQPDLFVKPHSVHQAICANHLIAQGYSVDHLVWPQSFIPASTYSQKPSIESFIEILLADNQNAILEVSQNHGLPGNLIVPTANELKPIIDTALSVLGSCPHIGKEVIIDAYDMAHIPFFDLALTYKASKISIAENGIYSKAYDLMLFANVVVYLYGKQQFSANNYSAVYFFNDYGPMTAMSLAAQVCNVAPVTITAPAIAGADFSKINLFNRPEVLHRIKRNEIWQFVKNLGVPASSLTLVETELSNKIGSLVHTSYSPASTDWSHQAFDQIRPDLPRVLLFPSSNDELYATSAHIKSVLRIELKDSQNLYADQFEWIQDIAEKCCRRGVQLIVRCHPRIDADHRGLPRSSEYDLWMKVGEQLEEMGHVFIGPSVSVSSYHLLALAHVIFVSWSSIAVEASLLGKNVYQFFCNVSSVRHYPDDSCFLPHIKNTDMLDRLFSKLQIKPEAAMNLGNPASERVIQSAKFFAWYKCMTSFSYDTADYASHSLGQGELFSRFLQKNGNPFTETWPEYEGYFYLINQLDWEQKLGNPTDNRPIEKQIIDLSQAFYKSLMDKYPYGLRNLVVPWGI